MIVLTTNNNEEIYLNPIKISEEGETPQIYHLIDEQENVWVKLKFTGNQFAINYQDSRISDSEEDITILLNDLVLQVIEQEQSGVEITEKVVLEVSPYDPESIKVHTKAFNVKLISDMIDNGDIDLSPDFQRNSVWNSLQNSKLIESILLRIPLPMFYFSEDAEGLITVVDGLQRLTAIKNFMDNKFPLKGLEYLSGSCEGRYYSDKNSDGTPNGKKAIESKYFRWFNMTQFTVNVIDPSSPTKVKYDIFKRINTGGKPLNSQEIRNCLASKNLRKILSDMTNLPIFKTATDNSIKPVRMEDKEVALRFICFYRYYFEEKDNALNNYNGNMEFTLDDMTEKLGREKEETLRKYEVLFSNAMKNAEYLFGKRAFRKILPKHLMPDAYKQLINKALFLSCSVLLSQYDFDRVAAQNERNVLSKALAHLIDTDRTLYNYLSFGTNGKANLQYTFSSIEKLITQNLKY
jgi:hypothetical protein